MLLRPVDVPRLGYVTLTLLVQRKKPSRKGKMNDMSQQNRNHRFIYCRSGIAVQKDGIEIRGFCEFRQ